MPVVITEYPKWIERSGKQVIVQSEDDEIDLDNQEEKDRMVAELKGSYGKTIDLRQYKGPTGFGTLKAYYEAVKARETDNVNSGNDSK